MPPLEPTPPGTHLAAPVSGARTVGLKWVAAEVDAPGSPEDAPQWDGWPDTGPCTASSLGSPLARTKPGDELGVSTRPECVLCSRPGVPKDQEPWRPQRLSTGDGGFVAEA